MRCFPLFINLQDADVLLIGQDRQAEDKLEKLLPYGARIHLFASNGFERFEAHPQITLCRRALTADDLTPAPAFVLVTDAPSADKKTIHTLCAERGIPINIADEPDLCSFYFPSLITRGACTIGITTSGQSPAIASLLRQRIEPEIPDRLEEILDWSHALRTQLKDSISDVHIRRNLLKSAAAEAMRKGRPLTDSELRALLADIPS